MARLDSDEAHEKRFGDCCVDGARGRFVLVRAGCPAGRPAGRPATVSSPYPHTNCQRRVHDAGGIVGLVW